MAQSKKTFTEKSWGKKMQDAAARLKDVRHNIREIEVDDTVNWRELVIEKKGADGKVERSLDVDKLKIWMSENLQAGAKWSGATLMWLSEYLVRGLNTVLVDNAALRAFEKKFSQKKKRGFAKNNPAFMAHAVYWAVMAGVIFGGTKFAESQSNQDEKKHKIENVAENSGKQKVVEEMANTISDIQNENFEVGVDNLKDKEIVSTPGTYGAYKKRFEAVTPLIIADIIGKEGVRQNSKGLHIPYQDSKGVWTIGFGSTQTKDGSVTAKTKPITTEEAYELARWHLEDGETNFMLYCYDVAFEGVNLSTVNEAVALNSLGYNLYCKIIESEDKNCKERFTQLQKLYKEQGDAVTDAQVLELFKKYPVKSPTSFGKVWLYGGKLTKAADKVGEFLNDAAGIRWRRWVEACVLNGEITPEELTQIPVGGLPEFFTIVGRNRENWFTGDRDHRKVNKKTVEKFKRWTQNPTDRYGNSISGWSVAGDFLPSGLLAQALANGTKLDVKKTKTVVSRHQQVVEKQTYVIDFEEEYAQAVAEYRAKRFKTAVTKYLDMIKKYPDNALLRNDLAATYNRLGKYDDAIKQARVILNDICDKSQYAAAQYNAGYAYEKSGNLEKALINYRLAVHNGNKTVQQDVKRVTSLIKSNKNSKIAFVGGKQIIKSRMKQNEKQKRADVLIYGEERIV